MVIFAQRSHRVIAKPVVGRVSQGARWLRLVLGRAQRFVLHFQLREELRGESPDPQTGGETMVTFSVQLESLANFIKRRRSQISSEMARSDYRLDS
jgi:hypothetical protein